MTLGVDWCCSRLLVPLLVLQSLLLLTLEVVPQQGCPSAALPAHALPCPAWWRAALGIDLRWYLLGSNLAARRRRRDGLSRCPVLPCLPALCWPPDHQRPPALAAAGPSRARDRPSHGCSAQWLPAPSSHSPPRHGNPIRQAHRLSSIHFHARTRLRWQAGLGWARLGSLPPALDYCERGPEVQTVRDAW